MTTDQRTPEDKATDNINHYWRIRNRADCLRRVKAELRDALKHTEKKTKPYKRLQLLLQMVELCDQDETAAWVNSWQSMEKVWTHWFKSEGWKQEAKP